MPKPTNTIARLRRIAEDFGGSDTSDGLFLLNVSDHLEHGDELADDPTPPMTDAEINIAMVNDGI
jgi:hypothetical protein